MTEINAGFGASWTKIARRFRTTGCYESRSLQGWWRDFKKTELVTIKSPSVYAFLAMTALLST
jgi:hypothetical protein